MKRWMLLPVLWTGLSMAYAQVPADTAPGLLPSSSRVFQLPAAPDWVGVDRRINEGFAKFGDPVSNFIFYAPKIGEDFLIGEVGNLRPDKSFFAAPPVEITYRYAQGAAPAWGKQYIISESAEGQLQIIFREEARVRAGEPTPLGDGQIRLTPKAEGGSLACEVAFEGSERLERSLKISTLPIPEGSPLGGVSEFVVAYEKVLPIGPDGSVQANGFELSIRRNPQSAYSFEGGKAYFFKPIEVKFLPIVVILLIVGAIFFTLFFGFVNFRRFGLAIQVVRGKYSNEEHLGEVSHFQALSAALSGTVGLGNIAGVAIAITVGGPGATLWMIVAGLLGMSSKFTECTLGVAYRTINSKGVVSGGPMYYLRDGLAKRGWKGFGKVFSVFFAIMCIGGSLGGGNMFQVNQAFKQFAGLEFVQGTWIANNGWMFGLVIAALVAVVIIGGIKSIASVTDKLVPFMVGIYMLGGFVILGLNFGEIPRAFADIWQGAFAPTAVAGGIIGVIIQGFRRAAFSNEAGVGSASIAHSAVKTDYPASEGIVSLLEPFIDTVVVCTMTALVIIVTNNHLDMGASDGVALTTKAFASQIPFFKYILLAAVILFAFSTMISWSYYGLKAWTFLFGDTRISDISYKVLYCAFVVIGAAASLGSVTDFSDAMIFAMAFPNIIGLFLLAPEAKLHLSKYLTLIGQMRAELRAKG